MAEGKKTFMMYVDQRSSFDELPDEYAGKLIKHLFAYVNDEHPETDDVLLKVAFAPLKAQLKRDLEKWRSKSKKNRENALKRWSMRTDANAQNAMRTDANHADKDTDTDTDTDKDKDISLKKKQKVFSGEIKNFTHSLFKYFDSVLIPEKKDSWYDVVDKLVRIDKLSSSQIETAVKNGRADNFWSKNFQSLTKLRSKNKDGVPYVKQFLTMKPRNNNPSINPLDSINQAFSELKAGNYE